MSFGETGQGLSYRTQLGNQNLRSQALVGLGRCTLAVGILLGSGFGDFGLQVVENRVAAADRSQTPARERADAGLKIDLPTYRSHMRQLRL